MKSVAIGGRREVATSHGEFQPKGGKGRALPWPTPSRVDPKARREYMGPRENINPRMRMEYRSPRHEMELREVKCISPRKKMGR